MSILCDTLSISRAWTLHLTLTLPPSPLSCFLQTPTAALLNISSLMPTASRRKYLTFAVKIPDQADQSSGILWHRACNRRLRATPAIDPDDIRVYHQLQRFLLLIFEKQIVITSTQPADTRTGAVGRRDVSTAFSQLCSAICTIKNSQDGSEGMAFSFSS